MGFQASPDGPSRRRRSRLLAGLAILVVALGAFAWQQGGGDGGGPLNAIAQAAEKTMSEPGGRAAIRAVVSSPARPPVTMTGRAVYEAEGRSRIVMEFPNPRTGSSATLEGVVDEAVMYMRSSVFGPLPGGKEWMELDFSSFGAHPESGLPAVNAAGELAVLESATGSVQKLGEKDVRGVRTTGYRGTVGAAEQAQQMREEGIDEDAASVAEKGGPLQVEAWIDDKGLVRRMRLVKEALEPGGEKSTIDMKIDFFDFGIEPQIDVPGSSEVFDATELARQGLDRLAGE